MGNFENDFELEAGMAVNLPEGVVIVANAVDLGRLQEDSALRRFDGWSLVALPVDAPLPAEAIAKARLLVVEVDPADRGSLRRLSQVREERRGLPVIAAIQKGDVPLVRTLVRAGISDVATLPFVADELVAQVLYACAQQAEDQPSAPLAPLITVVRSTGGCGATSVITHLAAALAQPSSGNARSVCVVDLDLQSGDVAGYLGISPKQDVSMLLEAGERLDGELLASALIDSGRGFSVVAAPDVITPLESVDVDQLLKLLDLIRRKHDVVLVELPADWTSWALSVVMAGSEVLLITDLSIGSLRQARRRLSLLASVGLKREKVGAIVNRVERRLFKTIGVDDVREALQCEVHATLAMENGALRSAQDQGALITEIDRRSRFAADIRSLAAMLIEREG